MLRVNESCCLLSANSHFSSTRNLANIHQGKSKIAKFAARLNVECAIFQINIHQYFAEKDLLKKKSIKFRLDEMTIHETTRTKEEKFVGENKRIKANESLVADLIVLRQTLEKLLFSCSHNLTATEF